MHSSFAERLSAISIGVAGVMQKSASVFDRTQAVPNAENGAMRALRITEDGQLRALVIGSCFSEHLTEYLRGSNCDADFVLFNNVGQLPSAAPRPMGEYDCQIVQIPLRSVIPEKAYFRALESDAAWDAVTDEAEERLFQLLRAPMRWNKESGTLTLVLNFFEPQSNPLGRTMSRLAKRNIVRLVRYLNDKLSQFVADYVNSYIVDCDTLSASFGRRYIQDDAYLQLNHGGTLGDDGRDTDLERLEAPSRLDQLYPNRRTEFMAAVVEEIRAIHRTVRGVDAVKLVIIDLDDTLWRGVVVESWRGSGHATEGYPLGLAEALLF